MVPDEVNRIADLARLDFSGPERDRFIPTFEEILDYFRQLEEVDTEGIEPTYHALDEAESGTPLREDSVRASLSVEEALGNSPQAREGQFRVPKVIE